MKVIDLHAARDNVYRARSRRRRCGGDSCCLGRRKSVERSQERICFGLQLFGLLQERLQPGLALLRGLHLRLDDLVDFFLLHSRIILRQDRSAQNVCRRNHRIKHEQGDDCLPASDFLNRRSVEQQEHHETQEDIDYEHDLKDGREMHGACHEPDQRNEGATNDQRQQHLPRHSSDDLVNLPRHGSSGNGCYTDAEQTCRLLADKRTSGCIT